MAGTSVVPLPAPLPTDMLNFYQTMYGVAWTMGNTMLLAMIGTFWNPLLPCPAYGVGVTLMRNIAYNMKWRQELQG